MKVGLLGHGVVGSGVRTIIDEGATWEVRELEVTAILVKDETEMTDPRTTLNADDIINDPEIQVVAECMGGLEPAHTYAKRALQAGKHVVTSNKKMLATFCGDLFDTARENGVTIHYEASCGGGIPWMASLDRTRRVDDIVSFRGIFNGTTNYILERMFHENRDFADMLKEAQKLGYAEQDPTDDIDGYDVRYKVALSCAKAFDAIVDAEKILTYGIRNITAQDLQFCRDSGYACKLMGKGEWHTDYISAMVIPVFLHADDVFANIPLNFNAIESNSKTLGSAAFVGQGAGSLPTAHAVVQNVIDIWKDQDSEINPKTRVPIDNQFHQGIYYIRTVKDALLASITDQRVGDHAILTKKISVLEAENAIRTLADQDLFIAEVAE